MAAEPPCCMMKSISTPLTATNTPPLHWTVTLASGLARILFVWPTYDVNGFLKTKKSMSQFIMRPCFWAPEEIRIRP